MDLLDEQHLIDACFMPEVDESEIITQNERMRQLNEQGYVLRWEPLYDTQGYSVAKRIGLFAVSQGYRPRLIEERFYRRGREEGTPWTSISHEQAVRYRNRDGQIMAGW